MRRHINTALAAYAKRKKTLGFFLISLDAVLLHFGNVYQ